MSRTTLHQKICRFTNWLRARRAPRRQPRRLGVETLSSRIALSVNASFLPSSGTLVVFGDNLDNTITVGRNAAGEILVNGGAVAVRGGTPTVANTARLFAFGLGGNDRITFDESNGALPGANIYGGSGNDTLTGGSGVDQISGDAGNDSLFGRGGGDRLFGGADDDVLTGGDGDDQVFGQAGNDRMVWNPGDDTDLNEGGAGVDTVEVNGGNGAENFTVTANGTRVRFDRLDPAPFALDIGASENLVLNANGGDDTFSATGNLAALISITADGGAGNDALLGSNGADLLIGGDGSDIVEGQDGTDTMRFNGSNANEIFDIAANGARVRFTRNVGNIVMDLGGMEAIELNTLGGTDTVSVGDLSGTGMTRVDVDLAGTFGGASGDAAADTIIVNGTNGNDAISVVGLGTTVSVLGLATVVTIENSEGANDSLVINALDGNDGVTATTLPAGVIQLTLDGGDDNDQLLGSQGADVFLGGAGNDFVFGDNGNDVAFLGAGDDVFQWDLGDGSDTVEGQGDADKLLFFGSNANENINVSANGGRALFLRDVGNITMDLDDVEVRCSCAT